MDNKYYLIVFKGSCADQFDAEGFIVCTEADWTNEKAKLQEADYPFVWGFGTNQELSFESFDQLMEKYTVKELDQLVYLAMKYLFGNKYSRIISFGLFPSV